jgi:hypothetical protein
LNPGLPHGNERASLAPAVFMCLVDLAIEVTDCPAEHALRPAVVTRKVYGANRTWHGAATLQTTPHPRASLKRDLSTNQVRF